MFGTYHKYQELLYKSQTIKNQTLNRTLAAILAGCTEAILTPFERVQMLLQHKAYDHTFNNTIHAFIELKKYGLKEYYRGLTPILLRNGPSNVVYFSSRDLVKNKYPQSAFWYINLLQDFVSGALIGATTSTIFYPLNAVRTRMQISPIEHRRPLNIIEAFKILYIERDRKFRNFYYGVHINFTRSLLSWGIITCVFECFMKHLKHQED